VNFQLALWLGRRGLGLAGCGGSGVAPPRPPSTNGAHAAASTRAHFEHLSIGPRPQGALHVQLLGRKGSARTLPGAALKRHDQGGATSGADGGPDGGGGDRGGTAQAR
jgi:hypothetical protein